jgi:DNA-binding CsgD family transcriptional regulator
MRVFLLDFRFVMVVGAASIMSTWNCEVIAAAFASAAVEPRLWVQAMDVIASETESEGALLIPLRGAIPNAPVSGSIRKATEKYFREGWNTRDERFRAIETMIRRGVADDFDFTTSEEMKNHPYYQDFLRPVGLHYFAGIKMTAGDDLWCVSLQRSPQQGGFSTDEKERLAALSPRLSSAATLARTLGFAAVNGAIEAFEVAGSAVVLLNRCAEVLHLNKAAEALLGMDLRMVERRLSCQDRHAAGELDRAVYSLLHDQTKSALMPPVPLPRRTGRPVLAYPVRLPTMSTSPLADCQALLVLVDLEARARPPQDILRSSFRLTAAESRLASRMASGETLERVAEDLRICKETARNQLKAVFHKVGVNRQAELVALLSAIL